MKDNTRHNRMRFIRLWRMLSHGSGLRSLRSVEMTVSIVLVFLLTSCGKNIDYLGIFMTFNDSPDERFAQSMEYNREHGYDKITGVPDEYELYVMSDIHVDNSTDNLDRYVSDYLADTTAAPFSLCLGDLINGTGHFDYFLEHVQHVSDAGRKIYYTVGNHDLYFNQWPAYFNRFGSSSYWFEVQTIGGFKDLYIAIESGSGTLGVDQRDWLEDVLKDKRNQGFRHIIVFTHTHFFKKDTSQGHTSNFNMEETYDLLDLFDRYNVSLVLQGHSHSRDITMFKDVTYLRVDAMEEHSSDAYYTILNVGGNINFEFIKVN